MARTGYTNLSPEHDRMRRFDLIARALGMDAASHADRVRMVDLALATLCKRTELLEFDIPLPVELTTSSREPPAS
jgi:hypothetical protein